MKRTLKKTKCKHKNNEFFWLFWNLMELNILGVLAGMFFEDFS
jgi:hypothetical protein